MRSESSPLPLRSSVKLKSSCAMLLVLFWGAAAGTLWGQDSAVPAPPPSVHSGLQVSSVSAYAAYYSKTLPNGGGIQPGGATLPSDVSGGGSAVIEWLKFSERSSFSLSYTPSYTGRVRYSSLNALNHALALSATRKLAPRWNFGFSVSGDVSSREESLFSPTTLSNVTSARSTFDDLAAAMLSARFTNNPQLGAIFNSAPLVESPLRTLLYGQRMFSSSAQVSLSYSYSPRLLVTFTGGGGRTQHLSDDQNLNSSSFLVLDTTSGNASVAFSYSLSPITTVGGSVASSRIVSSLQDAYTTTSLATLGRTFGRRWIMQIHGGVGVTTPVRKTALVLSTTPHPAGGGSLGYKTFSHTLLGSYERTVNDSYGVGAATSSSAGGSWRWKRPGHQWWLESSVGWQQLEGNVLTNTSGWNTTAGIGRSIGPYLAFFTQYAYLYYSGQQQRSNYSVSQSAVRISLVWSPHPVTPQ